MASFSGVNTILTYPVQDVSPSLECDTLEDGEHGKTKVVEVGDAEVRALPELAALGAFLAFKVPAAQRRIVLVHHFP